MIVCSLIYDSSSFDFAEKNKRPEQAYFWKQDKLTDSLAVRLNVWFNRIS